MSDEVEQSVPVADRSLVEWVEHPRISTVYTKTLLTADVNPLANVNLVMVPVGSQVSSHVHEYEVETVYVLTGRSTLVLGDKSIPFNAGQCVAIPMGMEHALINSGTDPVELLTFFTPPLP